MRIDVARALGIGLVVSSTLLATAPRADAQREDAAPETPLPLELRWSAPEGCPDGAYVERRLHRIVHVMPGAELPRVQADGNVESPRSGRHRLRLVTVVDGAPGEREIEGTSCAALADAAALVLAIAFGPGVEIAEPEAEIAEPVPEPVPVVEPVPEPAPDLPPEPPRDDRARVAPRVLGLVECQLLPGCGGGGAVGVDVTRRRLALEAEVRFVGEAYRELPAAPTVDGRFRATYGSLGACFEAAATAVGFRACGRARFGYAHGESRGALVDGSSRAPIAALGAGISARFPGTRRVALELGAELALSLYRPRFTIENVGEVHTVGLVLPSVFLGGRFGVGPR